MTERAAVTDPTGLSFLSYRRTRLSEAQLLVQAQHDVGIPTWQDIQDLQYEPTEEALRMILADPKIANAVLWVTPEVTDSPMIRKVEAPAIVRRCRQGSGFFMHPVAAGGLDYRGAGQVLAGCLEGEDLANWNVDRVQGDPIAAYEAAGVARRILRRRLEVIHAYLPPEQPLPLTLHTRTPPPMEPGTALRLNWVQRFEGRCATLDSWREVLLPALRTVVETIGRAASRRRIEASGQCSIPAGIALGAAFLAPRGVPISWRQRMPEGSHQLWSLEATPEPCGLAVRLIPHNVSAEDLAVLVGVSDDPMPAFDASGEILPSFRAVVRVCPRIGRSMQLITPGQAVDAARLIETAIRDARKQFRPAGMVHVFMAGPVGLAMLAGQLFNTLGSVQTYDHVGEDGVGRYQPAALLRPAA